MNFLPFVLILTTVICFSCSVLSVLTKTNFNKLNLIEAELDLENRSFGKIQETAFLYFPGKIKLKRKIKYENHRLNLDHYERSKCNLNPCLTSKIGFNFLIQSIQELYSPLFQSKEEAKALAIELKKKYTQLKKEGAEITIISLNPQPQSMKAIYKGMLLGNKNTPPFETLFFYNNEAQSNPLCFRFAKMSLFKLALGEELTSKILEFEENNFLSSKKKLKKEEVLQFLKDDGKSEKEIEKIMALFTFREPKKSIIHVEESNTNLGLRYQLFKKL